MNRTACGIIKSCLTQELKYDMMNETFAKSIWEIQANKYLTKSVKNWLHLKKRLYRFQLKDGISVSDHINNYTKLLADLTNLDVVLKDEDKVLILLSSDCTHLLHYFLLYFHIYRIINLLIFLS